jgi:beta-glucanase (GH16 family)
MRMWCKRVMFGLVCVVLAGHVGFAHASSNTWTFEQNEYKLVWSDEFDGDSLDRTKWNYRSLGPRLDGVIVTNAVTLDGEGNLVLSVTQVGDEYHCAEIATQHLPSGYWTFGYFEARVKFGKQVGHVPAFWLQCHQMGTPLFNPVEGGAEVDIFEYLRRDDPNIQHNLHWDGYGEHHKHIGRILPSPGIGEGWHTVGVLWTESEYVFFIDGQETWRTDLNGQGVSHKPSYIILSDHVRNWGGDIAEAVLPDYTYFDYVRVYQLVPPPALIWNVSGDGDWGTTTLITNANPVLPTDVGAGEWAVGNSTAGLVDLAGDKALRLAPSADSVGMALWLDVRTLGMSTGDYSMQFDVENFTYDYWDGDQTASAAAACVIKASGVDGGGTVTWDLLRGANFDPTVAAGGALLGSALGATSQTSINPMISSSGAVEFTANGTVTVDFTVNTGDEYIGLIFGVQDRNSSPRVGFDVDNIQIIPEPATGGNASYNTWVSGYELGGVDAFVGSDPDNDGVINFYEYAFGGNPTNGADTGIAGHVEVSEESGTNWFYYVYPRRLSPDNGGLIYTLTSAGNLVAPTWGTNVTETGYGQIGSTDMEMVTNRVEASASQLFIKLDVENQ